MRERKVFDPGIYDISNEEYHASAGISRSGILEFSKSPKHFWHKYLNPEYIKKDPTPEMKFGTAFHSYVLEPEKFTDEYYVMLDNPYHGNSTIGRKFKAEQIANSEGRSILSLDDYMQIEQMEKSINNDPQAYGLIANAQYEKSIYWIDTATQLLCKCRPDILKEQFVVDLKTTKDASEQQFKKDFYYRGYALQLAMIQEGIKHTTGIIIHDFLDLAIEKEEPYVTAIYPVDESYIQQGLAIFHVRLAQIKKCFDENKWPGYGVCAPLMPLHNLNGE